MDEPENMKPLNYEEHIYSRGDYSGEDELVTEIINICRNNKNIDEIKKELRYGIIGHFICCHNVIVSVKKTTEEFLKDRLEEASQEIFKHGNYGWHMCFHKMIENIVDELKRNK